MTRTMVRLRVAAAVSIGALALAACGSSGSTGGASSVAAPTGTPDVGIIGNTENVGTPVKGGTLTFADYAEARTLDPSKTYATGYSGGTALAAVYDVLVRYDPIKKEFTPQLAKDVKSNADFTQWTVTLRDGAKFSDGTPVDAAAVVSSAKWYLDNKGPDGAVIKPSLGGIRAEGTSTVVFDLTKPWATFPAMLGQGIGMVVAPAGHSGEFKPIGAGAFTMGTYAPKESLVLKANPGYWAGPPNLDELKFVFLNSDETRLDTMKSKGVDAAVLRDARSVQQAKTDGYAGYATVQSLGNAVLINNAPGKPVRTPASARPSTWRSTRPSSTTAPSTVTRGPARACSPRPRAGTPTCPRWPSTPRRPDSSSTRPRPTASAARSATSAATTPPTRPTPWRCRRCCRTRGSP